MKLHRFKNFWQVLNDYGHVKFQSHSKTEAEWYRDNYHDSSVLPLVNQHRGRAIKIINVYP